MHEATCGKIVQPPEETNIYEKEGRLKMIKKHVNFLCRIIKGILLQIPHTTTKQHGDKRIRVLSADENETV